MLYYALKVIISAAVIVAVSEVAKRSSLFGALIAALPLTSLLAIIWLRMEKVELQKITELSRSIFWLVLPSLFFFLLFPLLLNHGMKFWSGFGISAGITVLVYFILIWVLRAFNIHI
jgi:predicted permease